MKTVICLALLLIAAQANPLAELYLGFTDELNVDTRIQQAGIQCISQAEDAVHTFISILQTLQHHGSIEQILSLSHHLIEEVHSTIPVSCKTAIGGLFQYWEILAANTNVQKNWDKFHPEIIQLLGLVIFSPEIAVVPLTSYQSGATLAQNIKWLLGLSMPNYYYDADLIKADPKRIVPLNYKTLIPQFISGLLKSLYINNQMVARTLSDCVLNVVETAIKFEHGVHHLVEREILEALSQTIGSCKNAQQVAMAHFDRYHTSMQHGIGENLKLILEDSMINYPYYHKLLLSSLVKIQEGNYEFAGVYFGHVIQNAFHRLLPMQIDMPDRKVGNL